MRAGHTPSGGTGWQHPPAQAISAHHGRIIPCRPPQDCGSQGAQRRPQRYRIGDGVCAAYGPRRAARGSSSRGSKQQLGRACSTTPVGEVRLPQRKAAVPEKMHRDVLVAEAERSERAPTFKAHGAPPLARPSCRSAPPSRSRRRAPPHSCREGGDLSRGRLKGYQPRYPLFPYRSLILNPRFCLRKPSHVLMPRARMTNV